MKHVYLIGCKGIPARYGGFETFVENLTSHQQSNEIKYHVACMTDVNIKQKRFEYNGADCFYVKVPPIGPAKAIYYDVAAFHECLKHIKENRIQNPIVYVMACRMGPFIRKYKRQLEKMGGKYFVNPDGHEWLRAKWSYPVRKYWKLSEKSMIKYADLAICDSKNIQKYIDETYMQYHPKTEFIAYGTDIEHSSLVDQDEKVQAWYKEKKVIPGHYYLVVGRFVPENNYETMIREFMSSDTTKDFVIITNVKRNKFYEKLKKTTSFEQDARIKFVGTVYDQELLKYIREHAFAYVHGHEVGGTNPSLLEALGSTSLNLLLDVGFNREVGEDGALYFKKSLGGMKAVMQQAEALSQEEIAMLEGKAKKRIETQYSHEIIGMRYETVFLKEW